MADSDDDERARILANQGQTWTRLRPLRFERPSPLFDQPLEITPQMLRGLRMVDETVVVVHGHTKKRR